MGVLFYLYLYQVYILFSIFGLQINVFFIRMNVFYAVALYMAEIVTIKFHLRVGGLVTNKYQLLKIALWREVEEAACDIKMELKNYFLLYSDSAAVVAAITVGIDAYPAQPGDIAHGLPTRLLLVWEKSPRLPHNIPSVLTGSCMAAILLPACFW